MPGDLQRVTPGQPFQTTAETWNAFIDAAKAERARRGKGGGGPLDDLFESSLKCLVKNTGSSITTLSVFSVLAYSTPLISPATDEASRLLANKRPVFEGATPTDASAPFVITAEPIQGQTIGRAITAGLAVVQIDVDDAAHTHAKPIVGNSTKLVSCDSGGVPIIFKESGIGDKWAIVKLDFGDGAGSTYKIKLVASGAGVDGGTAWSSLIQQEVGGVVIDGDYLGGNDAANKFCAYATLSNKGNPITPAEGEVYTAVPDPERAGVWLFTPIYDGLCLDGCGSLMNVPKNTCLGMRMRGGTGKFSGMPSNSAPVPMFWAVTNEWVAIEMMDTCCGCGLGTFNITDPANMTAEVVLKGVHIACGTGSGPEVLTDITMKLEKCCRNELGKPVWIFVSADDTACDGDLEECENVFRASVECIDCPDPVCACTCGLQSAQAWFTNIDPPLFDDMDLNGGWVWRWSEGCTWVATCTPNGKTSTIEYIPEDQVFRLTHDTAIYEIDAATWVPMGTNSFAWVSGGGVDPPANISVASLQSVDFDGNPDESTDLCLPGNTLIVEVTDAGCPALDGVEITVTRGDPEIAEWTYGPTGGIEAFVRCVDGVWQAFAGVTCGANPYGVTTSTRPDSQSYDPLELEWTGQTMAGVEPPPFPLCCSENIGGVTINVTEVV